MHRAPTDEKHRRSVIANLSFILAILVFFSFSVINTIEENFIMALVSFLFMFPSALGLYFLRKNYDIDKVATFASIIFFIAVLIVLMLKGAREYSLLWSMPFAFVVMMLKGAQRGLYCSLGFYSIIFVITYSFIGDTITAAGYIRFVAVSIIMIAMAYYYEKTTQNAFDMLKDSIDVVGYLNKNLEHKVEEKTKEKSLLLSLFDKGDAVLFNWSNNEQFSVEDVSSSVYALTGYEKSELVSNGISYTSLICEEDIKRVRDEIFKAKESNIEFFKHEPYRIIAKDGSIKWVLDYTTIVRNENNEITDFIGVISDITHFKEQEKILHHKAKLAQMGEMISMIAHQWRQPLSTISMIALNLKMKIMLGNQDLEKKEYILEELDNINGCVRSLDTTIDDFRNFYKEDKKLVIMKLEELISKSLVLIETSLQKNKIKIITEYKDKEEIEVYDNEMRHVVINILKNAQDNFIEKQTEDPYIKITTGDRTISICDNGGGIPENIIEKVFDQNFSTKGEEKGTGLGLHMSKIIVQDHHSGDFKVKNTDDGVCFIIKLGMCP